MKSYHLTQEQALEIVNKVRPECKYAGSLELYPQSLTDIINAALDQVLGEPVGDLIISNVEDELLFTQRWHRESIGSLPDGEHKLYAPKESALGSLEQQPDGSVHFEEYKP